MSSGRVALGRLWASAPYCDGHFGAEQLTWLPQGTRRYLEHSIAHGTPLASAVWLRMRGEIRLRRWTPFRAEQVICRDRGMLWCARTRLGGLPVSGSDRLLAGRGEMTWRLLGVIPVRRASGLDVTRSAAGRVQAESIWLPSMLCATNVIWSAPTAGRIRAVFPVFGHPGALELRIARDGGLQSLAMQRWGDPDGTGFEYHDFGGMVDAERRFAGYTIPSRLRIGWHFGGEGFEPGGEFLRVIIDDAVYR